MEHSENWQDINNAITQWTIQNHFGILPGQLQSEKEVVIGWLQWSFREIDAEKLAKGINNDYNLNIRMFYCYTLKLIWIAQMGISLRILK